MPFLESIFTKQKPISKKGGVVLHFGSFHVPRFLKDFSYLLKYSFPLLCYFKYMKKIWPNTDMLLEKRGIYTFFNRPLDSCQYFSLMLH